MPKADPFYYYATRPVAPLGQAARGGSRLLSALGPTLSPMVDEYLADPEVNQAITGIGKQAGEGLFGQGTSGALLTEKAGPMLAKMLPRILAGGGSELLSLMGGMAGAPEEMWDPAVRRQNLLMSMARPNYGAPGGGMGSMGGGALLPMDSAPPGGGSEPGGFIGWDERQVGVPLPMDSAPPRQGPGAPDLGYDMPQMMDLKTTTGLQEPGAGNTAGGKLAGSVGNAVAPGTGAGEIMSAGAGAVESLAQAPGNIAKKAAGMASDTSWLDEVKKLPEKYAPRPAGDFGMRMGKFDLDPTLAGGAGAEIPDAMALWGETRPTTQEAGLLPTPPAPMGASPRLGSARRPGDDEFVSDNEFSTPTSERLFQPKGKPVMDFSVSEVYGKSDPLDLSGTDFSEGELYGPRGPLRAEGRPNTAGPQPTINIPGGTYSPQARAPKRTDTASALLNSLRGRIRREGAEPPRQPPPQGDVPYGYQSTQPRRRPAPGGFYRGGGV